MKKKLFLLLLAFCLLLSACADDESSSSLPTGSLSFSESVASEDVSDVKKEEKSPSVRLLEALGEEAEGKTLIDTGNEEIDGEMCITFALGTDSPGKFTAEEHYAVGKEKIYIMDIISGGDYIPFEK